jgi:hypothetical protein
MTAAVPVEQDDSIIRSFRIKNVGVFKQKKLK